MNNIKDFVEWIIACLVAGIAIYAPMILDKYIVDMGFNHPITVILFVVVAFEYSILIVKIKKMWERLNGKGRN